MTYDILSLVKIEKRDDPDGRTWYAVDPDIVYPATIKRIQAVLKSSEIPQELVDPASPIEVDPRGVARLYLSDASRVPADAWKLALIPRGEFDQDSPALGDRAFALEVARRWFTQALHVQTGGNGSGMGIHILAKDKAYRL